MAIDTFAENKQNLIVSPIKLKFTPENALFIVSYNDATYAQFQGVVIRSFDKTISEEGETQWLAGALVLSNGQQTPVNYSIFLRGKQKEIHYVPNLNLDDINHMAYTGSLDHMKEHIMSRKTVLNSWLVQAKTQADNLKRLRADAEVIADISRILEASEEIDIVKSEIENLEVDLKLLRDIFSSVKTLSVPSNYYRRELELEKQSNELMNLVKQTTSAEESRKNESQEEIQLKLSMVELTRYEDEDKLRQELIRLKKLPITAKVEVSPEPVKNYWDVQ